MLCRQVGIILSVFLVLVPWDKVKAQYATLAESNFTIAGEAFSTSGDCIQLTYDSFYSYGSVWLDQSINLNSSFDFTFNILFGCRDELGADGVVFVFAPWADIMGYAGEGMGFAGLEPSLGVEFDTYYNDHLQDLEEDHVALLRDGFVHHAVGLTAPISVLNLEDCQTHTVNIKWDHQMLLLRVLLDDQEIISYREDLVNQIFRGSPEVYWGISAATGKKRNRQSICFEQLEYIPGLESKSFSAEFIQQLEQGIQIDLPQIEYDSDTATANTDPYYMQYRLLHFMRHHPSYHLNIVGHANGHQSESDNFMLSKARAEEIAKFLIHHGIPKERLSSQGQGSNFFSANSEPNGRISIRAYINRT